MSQSSHNNKGNYPNNIAKVLLISKALIINQDKFLILQRSTYDKADPGKWEIPGGKVEQGSTIEKTLEKEIIEETGLK